MSIEHTHSTHPHDHLQFDDEYKVLFAEIAELTGEIASDLVSILGRANDPNSGMYVRRANVMPESAEGRFRRAQQMAAMLNSGMLPDIEWEMARSGELDRPDDANMEALLANAINGFSGRRTGGPRGSNPFSITGAPTHTQSYSGNTAPVTSPSLSDITPAPGTGSGRVTYQLGGTRRLPIQDRLMRILNAGAQAANVDVVIYSGGQPSSGSGRTGSHRHDNGYAADVHLYNGDGRRLSTSNSADLPVITRFVQAIRSAGATGVGAGSRVPGTTYMGNVGIHVDIAYGQPGVSPARYWGGPSMSANQAPIWLAQIMAPVSNA